MQRVEPRQRRSLQQQSTSSFSSGATTTTTSSPSTTTTSTMIRNSSSLDELHPPMDSVYHDEDEEREITTTTSTRNQQTSGNNNGTVTCWSFFSLPGAQHSAIVSTTTSSRTSTTPELRPFMESTSSSSLDNMEKAAAPPPLDEEVTIKSQQQQSASLTTKKRPLGRLRETLRQKSKPIDVGEYAAKREMTKRQEQWNALTMIPPSLLCILYVLSSAWLSTDLVHQAQEEPTTTTNSDNAFPKAGLTAWLNQLVGNERGCLPNPPFTSLQPWWPAALPPLAVWAVLLGTCLHMPFSFVYHWTYAHTLKASVRVHHWSRRMDQSMIHFASAMFAYASSGSLDYFLACALFNADCARRHFLPHFRPRSNQVRIGIAIAAYSLPILRRGDVDLFMAFWAIVGVSMWLFSRYPIGGWSHAAFHLAIGCLTPLLLAIAVELPVSQPQLRLAAQCAVWRDEAMVTA